MARIEVPMPQMGESIAEGTVSKWLKKVGDAVERDEPVLEISTDKVDAEIPAPQAGTLVEVMVQEGETVEVGTVVAYIDTEAASSETEISEDAASSDAAEADGETAVEAKDGDEGEEEDEAIGATADEEADADERRRGPTPVVRRMAEEHGVDLTALDGLGTGQGGRLTKQDLLEYLEGKSDQPEPVSDEGEKSKPAPVPTRPAASVEADSDLWQTFYKQVQHPEFPVREGDDVKSMDKIRRLTAEHMVLAKRVAPHVHSFIEIDFTRVDQLRQTHREKWKDQGVRVSYTAFVVWAVARLLREFPMLNATASADNIIYRGNVNVGIAVDLDPGLIVPVIRDADYLSLVGIGSKVVDLAERARARKLSPDEIQGATFSITNPGVLGTLVGLPIIPKGTAGILGTGAIEKRVVVVEDPATGQDAMAIRKRSIFSLGYDHRIVDGADSARFLSGLKEILEDFPDDA